MRFKTILERRVGKSAAKPERKQRRQRRTFVLARKTTRDRLTEEKSSCVRQREEGGIRCREGSECIVLRIDEANKCQRVRDRDRGLGESPVIMSSGPS